MAETATPITKENAIGLLQNSGFISAIYTRINRAQELGQNEMAEDLEDYLQTLFAAAQS